MMTRNKKKAGREYTREDWIQFHEKIVYWSEKRAARDRSETVNMKKKTENSTINPGQGIEQGSTDLLLGRQGDTGTENKSHRREEKLVIL